MSAFEAKFPGRCAAVCGNGIHPGDRVVYVDDRLVHEDCEDVMLGNIARAARAVSLQPAEVVCPNCFLVKPCPCDD